FSFFFSSRRRHTRFDCDWSSDVCSSDLPDDLYLQHSRAILLEEFGNTYITLGDLEMALTIHRNSLAIRERLVAADPSNLLWQYRSEEHTSELQSQSNLVCRLLLEKKKII